MKKIFAAFLVFSMAFIIGCGPTGKIIVKKDDFKNTTIVSLQLEGESKEAMSDSIFAGKYRGVFRYVREIGKDKNIPTRILVAVKGSTKSEDMTTKAFLKIDSEMMDMAINDRSTEVKSVTTSNSQNVYGGNKSGGYVDYTKPTGSKTTVSTSTWKELKGTMALSAEMEKKLEQASSIIIRVYSGPDPVTFTVKPEDIIKIKNFLATGPEAAK